TLTKAGKNVFLLRLRLQRGQANRPSGNRYTFPLAISLLFMTSFDVRAGDNIQAVGDILQFALPAAAGVTILGFNDGEGAVEFTESATLTLGTTYVLKYAVDERRP